MSEGSHIPSSALAEKMGVIANAMINSDFFIFISIFTLISYLRLVSLAELHSTALCKDSKIIKPSDESLRRTAAVRSMFMSNKSMSRL
jgi:hypothetical protein